MILTLFNLIELAFLCFTLKPPHHSKVSPTQAEKLLVGLVYYAVSIVKLPSDNIVTHVCNEKNFNGNFSNLDMKIGTIRDL